MANRSLQKGGSHSKDRLLVLAITLLFTAGWYSHSPILEKFSYLNYDAGVRMTFRNPGVADQIAIVAIDDQSLKQYGQWPWSRSRLADLIRKLSKVRTKSTVLTVPLLEAKTDPGLNHIKKLQNYIEKHKLPRQAAKQNRGIRQLLANAKRDLDSDNKLSRALYSAKNMVLPMYITLGTTDSKTQQALPNAIKKQRLSNVTPSKTKNTGPHSATKIEFPVEDFSNNVSTIGNMMFLRNSDGGIRSEPLLIRKNDYYYASLALLTAARSINVNPKYIKVEMGSHVQLGKLRINTDNNMVMYPGFYKNKNNESPFSVFSFSDVMSDKFNLSAFSKKIVIIGITSKAYNNNYTTPLFTAISAPEVVANFIASILNQDYYSKPEWTTLVEYTLTGFIFFFLMLIFPRISLGSATIISLVLIVTLVSTSQYFMIGQRIWLNTANPALYLAITYILLSMRRLLDSEHIKQMVDTDSAQSNRMLGLSFQAQGQLDMAMDKFRKLPVDNSVLDIIYNLALDYERKRQYNKAIAAYDYILEHNKKFRDITKRKTRAAKADGVLIGGNGQIATGGTMILSGSDHRPTLGRYEVERELGKGAMGVVYVGRDPKINREVAIKTLALSEEFEGNELESVKDRFFREAEAAGNLNHPNIVTIYDAGEEHDLAYIAMEYLEGKDLTSCIQQKKQASLKWVFNIIMQVADALDYAHKQDVVHRDIKPANIMYNEKEDSIKVTDFGIARITAASNTKTGIVLGTPSYMSPEQLAGERVDGRSDLFSLGVMMFELLTKKQPFSGDTMAALMYQITNTKHGDITKIRKNTPACVRTIVDKLLQKKPRNRYQTGAELAQALERCANKVL